jgi:hypothetical protein
MKNKIIYVVFTLLSFFAFQSCDDKGDNTIGDTSRVQLTLIDAEGDYEEVNIEIIDILYNSSEDEKGWSSFTPEGGYPINVDLTELIAGNNVLLTDEIISSGMLKQIRLVLSENNTLLLKNETSPVHLDTPSAQQSGLKIKLDTELEPGFSYNFILDWDVQKSIVKAGNSGKYILKPVIRANSEVNSGSISGKVIGEDLNDDISGPVPLNGVLVAVHRFNDDTFITESSTDENGNFIIQGLEPDNYKIIIEDYRYVNYESENEIPVQAGEVFSAGTIELQVPVN